MRSPVQQCGTVWVSGKNRLSWWQILAIFAISLLLSIALYGTLLAIWWANR